MTRMIYLAAGILLGGVAAYGALNYHVLRTSQGIELVAKSDTSLKDTYVDVRNFRLQDWTQHKDLASAVIKARKDYLLQAATENNVKDQFGKLMNEVNQLVPRQ